jgi:hypothetical protein
MMDDIPGQGVTSGNEMSSLIFFPIEKHRILETTSSNPVPDAQTFKKATVNQLPIQT